METKNTIYFVRHAESDTNIKDEILRPLTAKGREESRIIKSYLANKNIDLIYSSPYKRSIETLKDFSSYIDKEIIIIENLKERRISEEWIEDFDSFVENQWGDFNFKLNGGEALLEVQKRNIKAVQGILRNNPNKNIVVGTHGTALSTIINYFDNSFQYEEFKRIKNIMPWLIKMDFIDGRYIKIQEIDYKKG
ncbi:MAG: histidine phosphatase family protein [Miniphocaeibacter sp.]|uniref:histidine phosphatase family protein n=1 Tax=Miniphocaeibacter sp. TaxID=3100973 RepID=UPI001850E33D|nr:histidine phosphatase family protein [Gallicola sp.]